MHNQNPANCWRGFVWRGSSASLMVLRKTFLRDCSRFDTDSILGGSQPFHQPAVAPVGSPGSMPGGVSSMRSLLVKAVASVAQALAVPAPALAEAFRVPDDNAAAEGKHPSVAASSQLENISPYTDHIAPRHTARFALSFSLAERIWPRMASHSASPSFESAEKFPVPPRCPAPSMAIVWPVR